MAYIQVFEVHVYIDVNHNIPSRANSSCMRINLISYNGIQIQPVAQFLSITAKQVRSVVESNLFGEFE
jgi:hypothetical protein